MSDDSVEYFRRAIEHAPLDPGALAPNLTGWITPAGHRLCARCAGRIIARGCHLPRGAEPRWNETNPPTCVCCAPTPVEKTYPCCDDPDCGLCYGSGVAAELE